MTALLQILKVFVTCIFTLVTMFVVGVEFEFTRRQSSLSAKITGVFISVLLIALVILITLIFWDLV